LAELSHGYEFTEKPFHVHMYYVAFNHVDVDVLYTLAYVNSSLAHACSAMSASVS